MLSKNTGTPDGTEELKAITGGVNLVGKPHPLKDQTVSAVAEAGQTLQQTLGQIAPTAIVQYNGKEIAHEDLEGIVTQEGDVVNLSMAVYGGEGDDNKVLRTVLTVAVIAASIAVPALIGLSYGTLAFAATAAAIQVGGTLLVNALVPPPGMDFSSTNGEQFSRIGGLTGSRNQLAPYAPVPKVYGRHRIYPLMAAKPYTEVQANVQYLTLLFCLGYGPVRVHSPKIGDTPIGSFDASNKFTSNNNFKDVRIDVGNSPGIYTSDQNQEAVGVSLNETNDTTTRNTAIDSDRFTIEFIFPTGLFAINSDGETVSSSVELKIEYREVGTSTWINAIQKEESDPSWDPNRPDWRQARDFATRETGGTGSTTDPVLRLSGDERETLRNSLEVNPGGRGQYEVRVTRTGSTSTPTEGQAFQDLTWTALRSTTFTDPVEMDDVVFLAMKVKATDQINGVLDNFSVEVESRLAIYDDVAGSWDVPTFDPATGDGVGGALTDNPAWAYADILNGPANPSPVPRSEMDGATLKDWADFCETEGLGFNYPGDAKTTVFNMLRNVCSIGRASWAIQGGQFSVIQDRPKSTPVQVFTPRNSWEFQGSRIFPDIPHGLKVRYTSPENDWQEDERIVYDEGYTQATATEFQVLNLTGVTDKDQAWKLGRYFLAALRLRPETYTLNVDVEHIVAQRGDLVKVAHDVPQWGLGQGRLKATTTDGSGDTDTIALDEPVIMEAGKTYVVTIRTDQDRAVTETVTTQAGQQTTLTFTTPIPAAKNVAKGDIFAFGESTQETVDLLVKEIRPRENLAAELILVDYAPGIYDAGVLPIDFQPSDVNITTNVIALDDKKLDDQDELVFSSTGSLPAPLSAGTSYYAIDASDDGGIQVAATKGGAAIDLTSQGTGTHTVTRTIPDYTPVISQPVNLEDITPPAPTIQGIRSDETTLVKDSDGSNSQKMVVSFDLAPGFPSAQIQARFRKQGVLDGWTRSDLTDAPTGVISLYGVQKGETYVVQLRTRNGDRYSDWVEASPHTVLGKQGQPSNVQNFTVTLDQVVLRLSWDQIGDSDLREYEIRKGSDWATGTLMALVDATETTLGVTTTGSQTYWIKAIDTSGNYSPTAASAAVNVPEDWLDDVVRSGGSSTLQNITLNAGNPYLDIIESDNPNQNWRTTSVAGTYQVQELNDALAVQNVPLKINPGAPSDSLVVAGSGQLQVPDLAVGGQQLFAAGQEQELSKNANVAFNRLELPGGLRLYGSNASQAIEHDVLDGELVSIRQFFNNGSMFLKELIDPTNETIEWTSTVTGRTDHMFKMDFLNNILYVPNLEIIGVINYANEENLQIEDKTITLNKNGTDASSEGAGLIIERPGGNRTLAWTSGNGFTLNDDLTMGSKNIWLNNFRLFGSGPQTVFRPTADGLNDFKFDGNSWFIEPGLGINEEDIGTNALYVNGTTFLGGAVNVGGDIHISRTGSATLTIEADTGNTNEANNPVLRWVQDGQLISARMQLEGDSGTTLTGTETNSLVIAHDQNSPIHFGVGGSVVSTMKGGLFSVLTDTDIVANLRINEDLTPFSGYVSNIGAVNKKFLTAHIAELRVSTLVAAEERVTTGGRFLVGLATELAADLTAGATTISVKHNNLNSGDVIQLEGGGQLEFMAVTSAASGTGPYSYSVTRNLDGTGANAWEAGAGVFNTGSTGAGFLDLYAVNSLTGGTSTAGPTIAHMVRTGSGYAAIEPRTVTGNLKGHYGITTDDYGLAAGDPNSEHIIVNASDGVSIFSGANLAMQINSDLLTIGNLKYTASTDSLKAGGWIIDSNGLLFKPDVDYFIGINSARSDIQRTQGFYVYKNDALVTDDSVKFIRLGEISNVGTFNNFTGNKAGLQVWKGDTTSGGELFRLDQDGAKLSGFNLDTYRFYNDADTLEIDGNGNHFKVAKTDVENNGANYARLFYSDTDNWGFEGVVNNATVFTVGSINRISGFEFTRRHLTHVNGEKYFTMGSVSPGEAGSFTQGSEGFSMFINNEGLEDPNLSTKIVRLGRISDKDSTTGFTGNEYGLQVGIGESSNYRDVIRISNTEAFIGADVNIFGNLAVSSLPKLSDQNLLTSLSFDGSTIDAVSGNTPTVSGSSSYQKGISGEAFDFDGSTWLDYGTLAVNSSDFSVSFWTDNQVTADARTAICEASGDGRFIIVKQKDGVNRFAVYDGGSWRDFNSAHYPSGADLEHIIITHSNGSLSLIMNGELKETIASSVITLGSPSLAVGSYTNGSNENIGGLDEFRIYTSVLTEREWKYLYTSPAVGSGVISANTVKTGQLVSTNWTGPTGVKGSLFDLDAGLLHMRFGSKDIFKFSAADGTAKLSGANFDSEKLWAYDVDGGLELNWANNRLDFYTDNGTTEAVRIGSGRELPGEAGGIQKGVTVRTEPDSITQVGTGNKEGTNIFGSNTAGKNSVVFEGTVEITAATGTVESTLFVALMDAATGQTVDATSTIVLTAVNDPVSVTLFGGSIDPTNYYLRLQVLAQGSGGDKTVEFSGTLKEQQPTVSINLSGISVYQNPFTYTELTAGGNVFGGATYFKDLPTSDPGVLGKAYTRTAAQLGGSGTTKVMCISAG